MWKGERMLSFFLGSKRRMDDVQALPFPWGISVAFGPFGHGMFATWARGYTLPLEMGSTMVKWIGKGWIRGTINI
jgi:hypothetical protein